YFNVCRLAAGIVRDCVKSLDVSPDFTKSRLRAAETPIVKPHVDAHGRQSVIEHDAPLNAVLVIQFYSARRNLYPDDDVLPARLRALQDHVLRVPEQLSFRAINLEEDVRFSRDGVHL